MSGSNCCFLTHIQVSQETGKVVRYSYLRIFQFVVIHTVKGFSIVNEEVDIFLEFSCFSYDPTDVGNLISGSSVFSIPNLYIWRFSVHVLLKPCSENFEHYFASMWNECNCVVVGALFGMYSWWEVAISTQGTQPGTLWWPRRVWWWWWGEQGSSRKSIYV